MYTQEIFWGLNYANFPKATAVGNTMKYDELLATKCTVRSVCEHHLVPFTGTAWIGYLPKTKILGLSKFNRVVDFFSRRPQIQERLTAQITAALQLILETKDVACVIRAAHMCVMLRGIEDHQSETVTSEMGGRFFSKAPLRQEFLNLVNRH
jgi:GTP cyclohydrolase I